MSNYCDVEWNEYDENRYYEEGFYYVAIPINPMEGCVSRQVRFNGRNWYDTRGYAITKDARKEWVAIAEIPYPYDYDLDWRKKFPHFFRGVK